MSSHFWNDFVIIFLISSNFCFLKGVWHEIFDFKFCHVSVSPGPLSIQLVPFWILRKFVEIFANDTGNKLFTGVNSTSDKLSRMSLLLVINYCRCRWHRGDCALSQIFINSMSPAINLLLTVTTKPMTINAGNTNNGVSPVSTTPTIKLLYEH